MKELSINNFKYGLDTRREQLTSVLGTLVTCENGHINPGGEVEKMKGMVEVGLPDFDVPIFGLEFTSTTGYVFGSRTPLGSLTRPDFFLTGVACTLMILEHPSVLEGEGVNLAYHDMVAVKWSTVFNDKILVAAAYTDGNTFLYYDGELVKPSRNGRVLFGQTGLDDLSTALAAQIEEVVNWNAVANTDENGNVQNGTTLVKSPIGDYFTPVTVANSDAGQLGAALVDVDHAVTNETKASASFQVTAVGTFELTAPANQDGTGTAALTGGPVVGNTSTIVTAQMIVQAINDLSFVHGYTAQKNATDSVFVYAPAGWGASANTFNLTVTITGGGGGGGGGTPPNSLTMSFNPSSVDYEKVFPAGTSGNKNIIAYATAVPSGGSGTYPQYLWQAVSNPDGIVISNPAIATVAFSKVLSKNTEARGVFKCTVTDSAAASVEKQITVRLAYSTLD